VNNKILCSVLAAVLVGCASQAGKPARTTSAPAAVAPAAGAGTPPYPSTYQVPQSAPVAFSFDDPQPHNNRRHPHTDTDQPKGTC